MPVYDDVSKTQTANYSVGMITMMSSFKFVI